MKLIIFLLILGAAAYFAPVPIAHVEGTIEIMSNRDRVWGVLGDLTSGRLWDPIMKEPKLVSEVKSGIGTTRTAASVIVKTTEKVTEWVPYNRMAFEVTHEPKVTKFETSTMEMTPGGGDATRVRWTIDYQMAGGYLGFLGDRFVLGRFHQGRIDQGLANLKRYAETGEPSNY